MTLHLIRNMVESESNYGYDFKTDVWVFGDRKGFESFVEDLRRARTSREPIHVAAIPRDSPGMRCVIVPTAKYPKHEALVRILERIVFWQDTPTMQVVLCGNDRGFAQLESLMRAAMLATGGPLDHWHVDDAGDEWVVKRSISLNVRGAVEDWDTAKLEGYGEFLSTGGKHWFPGGFEWLRQDTEHSFECLPSDICEYALSLPVKGP